MQRPAHKIKLDRPVAAITRSVDRHDTFDELAITALAMLEQKDDANLRAILVLSA